MKQSKVVDIEQLLSDAYQVAQDVLGGKVPVAKASAFASNYRNVARFLAHRAKHGNSHFMIKSRGGK